MKFLNSKIIPSKLVIIRFGQYYNVSSYILGKNLVVFVLIIEYYLYLSLDNHWSSNNVTTNRHSLNDMTSWPGSTDNMWLQRQPFSTQVRGYFKHAGS